MTDIFASRREKLRRAMRARGLDAMLISQAANRFYLSGFELHDPQFNESAGRLVIAADGRDWLATDARYLDAAVRIWDRERIFIYGGSAARELHGLLRRCGSRIGLESQGVSLAFARALAAAGSGLYCEAADGMVERLRRIKEPCEIAALEKSFALNHKLMKWVEGQLEPGRTEADISWLIEKFFRENGASELAFANIVAVGKNAALPTQSPARTPSPTTVRCLLTWAAAWTATARIRPVHSGSAMRPPTPFAARSTLPGRRKRPPSRECAPACPCAWSTPWRTMFLPRRAWPAPLPTAWGTAWGLKPMKRPAFRRAPRARLRPAWS